MMAMATQDSLLQGLLMDEDLEEMIATATDDAMLWDSLDFFNKDAEEEPAEAMPVLPVTTSRSKQKAPLSTFSTSSSSGDEEMDEKALKRQQHRKAMQLCRERKRSRMGALEGEEKRLLQLLFQKLRLHEHQRHFQITSDVYNEAFMTRAEQLRNEFIDLLLLKESLEGEKGTLEASLSEHKRFARLLTLSKAQMEKESLLREIDEMSGDSERNITKALEEMEDENGGRWVRYVDTEPPFYYEPIDEEECAQWVRECYQRVRRLHSGFLLEQFPDIGVTHCFGWRAERSLSTNEQNQRILRFRFTRRVPRSYASLEAIQQRAWEIFNTPSLIARLYSSVVVAKVLQNINDDTVILLRNSPVRDRLLNLRYFSVNSRMEYTTDANERAVMLLMMLMDKEPPKKEIPSDMAKEASKTPAPQVTWLKDGTMYFTMTEKPRAEGEDEDAIEIEHGGMIRCVNEEQVRYLLVEIAMVLIRWEQISVMTPLLLTSQ
ncbi:hypothetical protein Poli38472_012533 [Pythium oligandrum]|uniref:Uncharacterized protein n=1 Tax=Pythium oligandrum TaxID=41045 RepID=A0A8K1CDM2_PYTOL|nr:hypothetical protein Poli38472_012533 [Pythium oligandrum]|eukprot:TMW61342.1 hypothetical protein Poli38472_012533 [Pythium oligandrum]